MLSPRHVKERDRGRRGTPLAVSHSSRLGLVGTYCQLVGTGEFAGPTFVRRQLWALMATRLSSMLSYIVPWQSGWAPVTGNACLPGGFVAHRRGPVLAVSPDIAGMRCPLVAAGCPRPDVTYAAVKLCCTSSLTITARRQSRWSNLWGSQSLLQPRSRGRVALSRDHLAQCPADPVETHQISSHGSARGWRRSNLSAGGHRIWFGFGATHVDVMS